MHMIYVNSYRETTYTLHIVIEFTTYRSNWFGVQYRGKRRPSKTEKKERKKKQILSIMAASHEKLRKLSNLTQHTKTLFWLMD